MLKLLKGIFATGKGPACLLHIHLCGESGGQVLCHVAGRVLAQVNALFSQHLVCLILHNVHLFSELDLATVEVHEDVDVESMQNLVLLREELLAFEILSFLILSMPSLLVDLPLEQVLVLELKFTGFNLSLFLVTFVFIKCILFALFADAVTLLTQDQILPTLSDLSNTLFHICNLLVVSGDAHSSRDCSTAVQTSLQSFFTVLDQLAKSGA